MRLPWPDLRARLRPSRPRLTSRSLLRAGLAAALVAGVLAVGFGAGYRSANVVLTDDGGYVQKGHRVAHVNAASGGVDAEAPADSATGDTQLQVTQDGSGAVIVVDPTTHQAARLPIDTLTPAPITTAPAGPGLSAAAGGGQAYLLDPQNGTVSQLADGGTTPPVTVDTPVRVDQMVVDGTGTAWAYSTPTGDLFEITGGQLRDRRHAGRPADHSTLTLAGGRPVLYDADTGQATGYGDGPGLVPVNLAVSGGLPAAPQTPPADGSQAAPVLVVVVPATADLVAGDLGSGQVRQLRLPDQSGDRFGAPVVAAGRIYLPNFDKHQVTVLDLARFRVLRKVAVPGNSSTFQVSVQGDRVWVNDPYERRMLTFDSDGHVDPIDKGNGDGVTPERLPGDPEPSASASPAPTQSPGVQDLPAGPTTTPHTTTSAPRPPGARRATVPRLVGLDRAQAKRACQQAGLDCRFAATDTGSGRTDVVLASDPPEGATVSRGSVVNVVYRGPASVPDLVGEKVDQACAGLRAIALDCTRQAAGLAGNASAVGVVTRQQPPAGAAVATGTKVSLSYPALVATPTVGGQPWQTACAIVTQAGLACDATNIGTAPTGTAAGVVVAQAPVPGAGADPGQPVTVQYYGSVGVPNVLGAAPAQACAALQAAQLACVPSDSEQTTQCNVVHGQSVPPGTAAPAGSPVTITYLDACPVTLHKYSQRGTTCDVVCNTKYFDNNKVYLYGVFLGVGGPPPGYAPGRGKNVETDVGSGYPAGAPGSAGLVNVYQFNAPGYPCTVVNSCNAEDTRYYFSAGTSPPDGFHLAGAAFSCFNPNAPQPPGTRPLMAMFDGGRWAWAVQGTAGYTNYLDSGFTKGSFLLCYVW
jgi:beta-lactam-binding protein with PASTA domain/outer membrane protein assembly factor BamB